MDQVIISGLTAELIPKAVEFCEYLKANDYHPCSFWGYDLDRFTQALNTPDQSIFVAQKEEQIAGLATITKGGLFQDHWAEVGVVVHPSFRGQGIAKQLVIELEKAFPNLEFCKALILENNTQSQEFFKKLGYDYKYTLLHEFDLPRFGKINDLAFYKFF